MSPPRIIGCTAITQQCTVENTIYGYYPNLGGNIVFVAIFGACCVAQLVLGLRTRSWTFMAVMTIGAFTEGLGYVGRVILHDNPYSTVGFEIQICCLIMAPALIAAGIYVTLKHIVLALGPQYSYIKASYYPWTFFSMDLLCLILQGVGGGLAATAKTNLTQLNLGSNLMMAGIVWQVVNLLVFFGVAGQFFRDVFVNRHSLTESSRALGRNLRFRMFLAAVLIAALAIFIRCVYRIAEMAHGWANPIMRNEAEFMVLDGGMCAIAVLVLTIFHPGYFFKEMQRHGRKSEEKEAGYGSPTGIETPSEK